LPSAIGLPFGEGRSVAQQAIDTGRDARAH
jgi:hypothetical protein